MRLGDTCDSLEGVDESVHTQPNTVLLKEPGLYCFLLRFDHKFALIELKI